MILKIPTVAICIAFFFGFGQGIFAQVSDDFSDGDFSNNPTWTGDDDLFVVDTEQLRSNSSGAADYYLSTPNSLIVDAEWMFYINLDLATSGVNYVDVYLAADNEVLGLSDNAYFIRFGGTADEISFYKKVNGVQTLLIDGSDGLVGSSSNNRFVMHAARDGSGNWNLNYDIGAIGLFNSLGNVTDTDIASTQHFGFHVEQSSAGSAVNSHFFDNIEISALLPDITPPEVLSVVSISESELLVTFNEHLLETSAEDALHYTVNNGIDVASSALLNDANLSELTVTFANPFQSGANYILTVSDVEDLSGNVLLSQDIGFSFLEISPGAFKEVVFNEIFADPTPIVGLPEAEYLELYNASNSFFDMEDWVLVNTTTEKTLTTKSLAPGAYLILCDEDDQSLFEPFGEVLAIPSFSALSNASDSLTLKNALGDIIDIVVYSDTWYGDSELADGGYSLELINPTTECGGASNWTASSSSLGGTPGIQNSVYDISPDVTSPELTAYSVLTPQSIEISFSEVMDEASLSTATYLWNEGITTTDQIPATDLTSVVLTLSAALQPGTAYELNISGPTDCAGNALIGDTSFEIFLGEMPLPGELLISEIMADPSPSNGLPEAEYFEIHNIGNRPLELSGCALNDKVFSAAQVLLPGEYIICIDDEAAIDFLVYPRKYLVEDLGATYLTNGGRELALYNSDGDILDKFTYELSWYRDSDKEDGGYSLERINLLELCRGGDNWIGSEAELGGTPNAQNSVYSEEADLTPPVVTQVFVISATELEVIFSENLDSLSVPSVVAVIAPEIEIVDLAYRTGNTNSVFVTLASAVEDGIVYELSISEVFDCSGNEMVPVSHLQFGFPEQGEVGDLLINEVLFNPFTGGVDFVEIYNASDKIVGLQNWVLQNADFTTRIISELPIIILPGAYLVLTTDGQSTYRDYPLGRPENFLEMESMPSFNNSEGTVILADEAENQIDRFDYSEDYHLSLLVSFKGVSLERVSFTMDTNSPDNWTSAAENVGYATPGYLNSQYNPEGISGSTVSLKEDIFSPDNDGFQDLLFINYNLGGTGFIANITIYDARGSEVKQLTNNLAIGTQGSITWDGVANNGSKARIGPHIVYVDLFDEEGKSETFKLPCVLAGKLSD